MAVEGRPKNFRFSRGSGVNKVKHSPEPKHETSNTARIFDNAIYYRGFEKVEEYHAETDTVVSYRVLDHSMEHSERFYGKRVNLLRANPFNNPDDIHVERSRKGIKSQDWSTDKLL